MPGMISIKNNPTMSFGRTSTMHPRCGTVGSNHFSTVRGPKAYMSQTKASLARRQSQVAPALTDSTFTCPLQENIPYETCCSSSNSDSATEENQDAAVSPGLDNQFLDGYHHEDTPWEIMQFRPDNDPKDGASSFCDTFQEDAWTSSIQASRIAADDDSGQSWDVNYIHSDSAWEFLQFGTQNFMEGRRMSDDPNAVWDAPIEDPIDEDVALRYELNQQEDDLDRTQYQHYREYADDGCGLVYLACNGGTAERVCNDCGSTPCECDEDQTEHTLKVDNKSGNIDSKKIHSVKSLDQHAAMLNAEIDKLVNDVDYLKRQKLRFARDAARYCNIGQRFRSQLEKSNAELCNCEFRLIKSQGVTARFRQAFLQLGLMLHKYHGLGITEEDNDVLGQVRYIIGGLVDLVQDEDG